jgi:hypothetical protein
LPLVFERIRPFDRQIECQDTNMHFAKRGLSPARLVPARRSGRNEAVF